MNRLNLARRRYLDGSRSGYIATFELAVPIHHCKTDSPDFGQNIPLCIFVVEKQDNVDLWPLHLELPLVAATISSASYLQISIVFAFFYWLLNARVRAMVNIMANNIHEAYNGGPATQSGSLHHQLSQMQLRKKEQLMLRKDSNLTTLENAVYATKNSLCSTNVFTQPQKRPVTGLSCLECTPETRKSAGSSENALPGINILDLRAFRNPPTGLAGTFATAYHCATFASHDFKYVYKSVLRDEIVQEAIRQTAEDTAKELGITDAHGLELLYANNKTRAFKILTRMHSKLSNFVVRLIAWVLHKTLPLLFKSMTVPAHQLEMLKEASKKGKPLIYLPLHRSHIDYIAVTFTLCNLGLRSPLVAAGANLNIPFFGRILSGLGAFFIKRRIDPVEGKKDKIYRAILHTYITQCIEAGHHFEFFIEGGRTRTGKPCMPKGGLLSVFVDAYLSNILEDALLVPVSVNYEKITEGSFVRELTGEPKKPESFFGAVKGIWKALTDEYGMVRVDFNQPFSLQELVRSFHSSRISFRDEPLHVVPSSASLYGTDMAVEDQRNLVDSIARHIIYDCARSTAVMSTNALAFLLLHVRREGATLGELTSDMDVLRRDLTDSGKDLGFCGESKDVLEHAIDLLGPGLVQKEKTPEGDVFVKPVTILPNVIELSYYANSLLPHFALDSVIALAILSLIKDSQVDKPTVEINELVETCKELCGFMQYEFIFTKSCQSLADAIYYSIERFTSMEILVRLESPYAKSGKSWGNLDIADDFESDDGEPYVVPVRFKVNVNNRKLAIYSHLLRPIVDAYYYTAFFFKSRGDESVEENLLVKGILADISCKIKEGTISNGETLSSEHVKNCLKLLDKRDAASVTTFNGQRLYSLNEKNAEDICERMLRF